MATDLATLAIKVDNGDVIKTTTSLNSMEVAGTKAEASTQRLTRRMALLEIQARQMDAEMAKSATIMGRAAAAMNVTRETADKLGIALGALSVLAAIGFIGRKTIEETEQAQAAMAQLEAAVTSTGGAAGRSVQQLDELSLALQKTTTYSDEAVKGAEAVLLTFDKIKGDTFDRATRDVTDLAARLGKDLPDAALQVGKALQDPLQGMNALQRLGIRLSASQKQTIQDFVDTGRSAEAMGVILSELERKFGGSAAAARDTLGGALAGLKNAFGDLFEVSKGASQGTVSAINDITAALEGSGLSMNSVLKDAAVDWETMRASIEKTKVVLTTPLGPGWFDKTQGIIDRINFDLNTKIAEMNKPAKTAPVGTGGGTGTDLSDEAKKFDALVQSREEELGKLTALNGAYRENSEALKILGLEYDAQIQKSHDIEGHTARQRALLDGLTDATLKQKIAQVQLNDELEREARLQASRDANTATLEAALNARDRAGLSGPDAEIQAIRDAATEESAAAQRVHDQKKRLSALDQIEADKELAEAKRTANAKADIEIEGIQRARQAATAQSIGLTVADTEAQTNAIRAMAAAELQGGKAAEEMSIQLAGQDAVQRAVNDATARGTTVTDEQKDALRRSAEEMQRAQIEAAKLQAVFNQVSSAANQFFTDVFNRKNPFPGLAQRIKEELIAALSDAVARPITVTIAKIIGIDVESKQEKAAKVMNEAADKQLRAAQIMNGGDTSSVPGGAPPQASAAVEQWKRAMGIVGAGAIGYGTGYGIGQGTGSGVLGALGGAVAGAKAGAVFGAPGAIVGAIAGFAGGILGAGDAAKEAAAKLEAARISFKNSWDAIVAEINGDALAQAIANANDRFQQLAQQYADTLTVEDIIHGKLATGLANINALQQEYVDGLKREAAAKARTQIESYRERELRAEGRNAEADALHAQEERQQLIDSFGKDIDATEQQILAAYDAAAAAEKNAAAVDRNTAALVSLHNAPQGFKYQQYLYDYGTPRPPTFSPSTPNFPQTPLGGGLQLSRGSKTYNVTFVIDGTKTTRAQAQQIANEFKRVANETLGSNADASDGMNMLVS